MKKAIIVGYTGQDGTYLTDLLNAKGYQLIGISSRAVTWNSLGFKYINIINYEHVAELVNKFQPDEIYFLAAAQYSSVDVYIEEGALFQDSLNINVKSLVNFLESIRKYSAHTKLFYAASSHVFGNPLVSPQNELTPFEPNCIYGITKTAGIHACCFYRNTHNIYASIGIMYNHESPLREAKYVAKKIVEAAVAIKNNKKNELVLGDIDAQVDLGYALDYMNAAYKIVQLDKPDVFVISSGGLHTIREFVIGVFEYLSLDFQKYVSINPSLISKRQKRNLFGDNTKLKKMTSWAPSIDFKGFIKLLVDDQILKYK